MSIAEDTLELTRAQARSGQVTERDAAQASGALEAIRASLPVLETEVAVAIHRLGILLGDPPEALMSELSPEGSIPTPPQNVSAGIPSELLERRPDILRAADSHTPSTMDRNQCIRCLEYAMKRDG